MNRLSSAAAIALFASQLVPAQWSRDSARISDELASAVTDEAGEPEQDFIVQFVTPPEESEFRRVGRRGGKLRGIHGEGRNAHYRMTARAARELAGDANVAYVSPDREVRASGTNDYTMVTVGAIQAQSYGYDGRNIGVAIVDSGVDGGIPDLQDPTCTKPRLVYKEDFVTWNGDSWDPYGHGTHVAGIVGGNGFCKVQGTAYKGLPGVAPRVNLISLRALDKRGVGRDSSVIAAIDRAVALKNTYNIRVLNLSLGRVIKESYTKDPLCQAVERAWKAGIVVVVAAGNNGRDNSMGTSGYSTITSPGNDPFVITVGAMRDMKTPSKGDDQIATYSSKGPTLIDQFVKPDLMAPGNLVNSVKPWGSYIQTTYTGNTVPGEWPNGTQFDTYFFLSGTSMATPIVSGAAALLLQKDPTLTPDQVKARLMKTASKNFPAASIWTDPVTRTTYTASADIFTVGARLSRYHGGAE